MTKYINKKNILIAMGVTLLLLLIPGNDNEAVWVPEMMSNDTNHYIPMDGRIAVYSFEGYKKGLGIKYTSSFEHDGLTFYTPSDEDIPANIITRKSLFEYRLYEFSHFVVKSEAELAEDIANGSAYLSGYDANDYDFSSYDFNDILKVFGVSSASDIKSVDYGYLQYPKEEMTNKAEIDAFYSIISNIECVPYISDGKSVFGHDITINLKNGMSIDGLYYSRTRGMVYYVYDTVYIYREKGFVAYLTEAQQQLIESLILND